MLGDRLNAELVRKLYNRGRSLLVRGLGAFAERLLARHRQQMLEIKPISSLRYVTMGGRKHWLLLRESLVSLHRAWNSIPCLTVVSDGSWEKQEFLDAFRFWPGPMEVLMPDDITGPLSDAGKDVLVQMAAQHPLGDRK